MRLSPPRSLTFLFSLVLAALAIASLYVHVPVINAFVTTHRFWILVAAYVVLALGVLLRDF